MTETGHPLQLREVCKSYRRGVLANDHVSLDLPPGEVFGLLGPNGAGKTTLVSQIIGLMKPDSGEIRYGSNDLVKQPALARRLASYLPQTQIPIDHVPLAAAAEMFGRMRGGPPGEVRARARQLIEALEIEEWAGAPGNRLSGGVRRLAGFVMAAVWRRPLIILDEPTNDVDPLRRRLLWQQIRELAAAGSAVLLVTHNVLEAERAVDRLAIIDRGRVLGQGTPAELTRQRGGSALRLELILEPGVEAPAPPGFLTRHAQAGRRLMLQLDEAAAADALDWARGQRLAGIAETFELGPVTLEDTYLSIAGAGAASGPSGGAP